MEQILIYQYDIAEEIVPPNDSYLDFGFDDFVETIHNEYLHPT